MYFETQSRMSDSDAVESNKALHRAKALLGGWAAMADALTRVTGQPVTRQNCQGWDRRGLPVHRAVPLEKATQYKVRRWELRPDIYQRRDR